MKDKIKSLLIDEILMGGDVYLHRGEYWSLLTKTNDVYLDSIFYWTPALNPPDEPKTGPITLKQALEFVDAHWGQKAGEIK